jgi:hypothetical protein
VKLLVERATARDRKVSPSDIEWTPPILPFFVNVAGAPGRTRTADAGLRTASLYPLSYGGADFIVPRLGDNAARP